MKIRKTYSAILNIIPPEKRKRLLAFFLKSILFGILDLLSIAYLIPILILFFDPNKLQTIINENTGVAINVSNQAVSWFIVAALLFFVVKAIFQTRFNTALYVFLYDLFDRFIDVVYAQFHQRKLYRLAERKQRKSYAEYHDRAGRFLLSVSACRDLSGFRNHCTCCDTDRNVVPVFQNNLAGIAYFMRICAVYFLYPETTTDGYRHRLPQITHEGQQPFA
ncbi:hypothetical protein [Flavobacterium sp. 3HN19-14]|uniref:hypothetical protein n=1 Tax=Flavobacterium sp. 3HN19-14 TaxID=3448133 RepID=UPI003EE11B5D